MNLKPTDIAKGILTGHLDIAMHGRTPMQLAQTVKGPIQLAVEDGKLSGNADRSRGNRYLGNNR